MDGESDVEDWNQFLHIPDLSSERITQGKADAAHNSKVRLRREGLLLAEYGGARARKVPFPQWCPAADGAGFLVAWSPPEFTSIEPVPIHRVGPPWSAGPTPIGVMAGYDVQD